MKTKKFLIIPLIIMILSIISLLYFKINSAPIKDKPYSLFLADVNNDKISTVYLTSSPKLKIKLKDNSLYITDNPKSPTLKEELLKKDIYISESQPISKLETISILSLIISISILLVFFIKSSNITSKGLLSVDSMDIDNVQNTGIRLQSIAGNEEAKDSVMDIVDFLKTPEKYATYGARMPKGIILYGEPGTGKTLLAKAVATEANVPFYAVSGSDFIQIYVGVGASRIRQLFKKARSNGKAVIFIDEIDAIGKMRDNSKKGGSEERDQTLNALLTEMSGFNEKEGIVVMAATNRLDMLDPALLRPGRFDRHIEITLPDVSAREKILSLYLQNKPAKDINVAEWAQKTAYFSGAKIENLINESAIIACKENSDFINEKHIDKAYSIVLAGYEKINRNYIDLADKKLTAFHEIGHALVSLKLLPFEKISKVTIIPSSKGAGGYTISIPKDTMYQDKEYLLKKIMVLLAGRAAEELIFGKNAITTGAHNDIKNSTNIAINMLTQYGMGDTLGLLNISELQSLDNNLYKDVVIECRNLVDSLYTETINLLRENKIFLDSLSEELINKETLFYEDIIKIAG